MQYLGVEHILIKIKIEKNALNSSLETARAVMFFDWQYKMFCSSTINSNKASSKKSSKISRGLKSLYLL